MTAAARLAVLVTVLVALPPREGLGLPEYDPSNPNHVAHEKEMNLALENLEGGGQLCHR